MICVCSKTYRCFDLQSIKLTFSSKGLYKRTLEDSGDGPMSKYRKILKEVLNVTPTKGGFPTKQHAVATYERKKKGLSFFVFFCLEKRRIKNFYHQRNVSKMENTLVPLIYYYRLFNIMYQYLWVTYNICFCCQL